MFISLECRPKKYQAVTPLNTKSKSDLGHDFQPRLAHVPQVKNREPRELAVRILQHRERASEYIEDLLTLELAHLQLAPADRALVQEITYGAVRWEATLDWLIARKTQTRPQKAALQILLRLGLYQLFWLERIPDHAAVNETVALAKNLGFGPQAGFINAVLRGYLRERGQTEQLLKELKVQQPDLGYSHPEWLFVRWEKRWGRDRAIQLMDWNNQPPKTYARVNTLRVTRDALLEAWKTESVTCAPVHCQWVPEGLMYELQSHPRLTDLPSFRNGSFYIQDPSTVLAVEELQPQSEDALLDLCAAPGGKTTYLAQLINNRGQIVAQDLQPQRLDLIRENCARLGVTCAQVILAPEVAADAHFPEFDRVLLDAPCSNTGVMRRRVDLRWRIRPQEISRLHAAQFSLLQRAARQVKPGGTLVYSTCSLEPEENREVIDRLLKEQPVFKLELERELLPFADQVDGAYVARLSRSPTA
jgi:16S rRNA (cytosine967-C5)-methyltransferase